MNNELSTISIKAPSLEAMPVVLIWLNAMYFPGLIFTLVLAHADSTRVRRSCSWSVTVRACRLSFRLRLALCHLK